MTYVLSDWSYIGGYDTEHKSLNDIANWLGVSPFDVLEAFNKGESIAGCTIDKEEIA